MDKLNLKSLPIQTIACPVCASNEPSLLIKKDRYGININISKCGVCNHIYTAKNISMKYLPHFYRQQYRLLYNSVNKVDDQFIGSSNDLVYATIRSIKLKAKLPYFDKILEIGSGTGQFLNCLRILGCTQYFGLEPGETFYNYITSNPLLSTHIIKKFWSDSDVNIPFAPKNIVLFHVFEHLYDPSSFLRWAHKLFDKSEQSRIVIEVPCFDDDTLWWKQGIADFHIAHISYFTSESISKVLVNNGFEVVDIEKDFRENICSNNMRVYCKPLYEDSLTDSRKIFSLILDPKHDESVRSTISKIKSNSFKLRSVFYRVNNIKNYLKDYFRIQRIFVNL